MMIDYTVILPEESITCRPYEHQPICLSMRLSFTLSGGERYWIDEYV
jgi:hypothetical protein